MKYPTEFFVQAPNPELAQELVKHIAKGSTPEGAARLLGVPRTRFRKWMREGAERVEQAYDTGDRALALTHEAMMFVAVERATAETAQRLGKQVQAGHEEWRAKLAWLERQERDDFQPAERVDITVGGSDEPVLIEGRAVVGLANVLEFVRSIGQPHLLDDALDAGDSRRGLPAAQDVLPDPAAGERAAGGVPASEPS